MEKKHPLPQSFKDKLDKLQKNHKTKQKAIMQIIPKKRNVDPIPGMFWSHLFHM